MLMNLYRTVGSVVCLATLSFVGCAEEGSGASVAATDAVGDAQVQTASFDMTPDPVAELPAPTVEVAAIDDTDDDKPKDDKKDTGKAIRKGGPELGTTSSQGNTRDLSQRSKYDLSAGPGSRGDLSNTPLDVDPAEYIVKAEPASLDLGEVGTGDTAKGSFELINTGDKPMRLIQCKANCGCTVPKCPKNTEIQPGESIEIDVAMTAGNKGGIKKSKRVDIVIEGQPLLRVPVSVDVVAYVEVSPSIIGPNVNKDGRIVIRSLDNTPFRILSMTPPLIDGLDAEAENDPLIEHVLYLSWDIWKEKGSARVLRFAADHPRVKEIKVNVRAIRQRPQRNPRNIPAIATINLENAIAARRGDVEKILAVTKTKEDLELVDSRGATLLGLAASAGQTEVVKVLLDADAKPDAMDRNGRTPLMAAVQKRDTNIDTLKALIAGGADVNTKDKRSGASVLCWASGLWGSIEMVELLLEAGSDVNVTDNRGDTPLMWAARFGTTESVKAIIQAGADVTVANKKGDTALVYISKRRANASLVSEITSLIKEGAIAQD